LASCYYTKDGRLHYAGTSITDNELKRLASVLKPLHVPKMPLAGDILEEQSRDAWRIGLVPCGPLDSAGAEVT